MSQQKRSAGKQGNVSYVIKAYVTAFLPRWIHRLRRKLVMKGWESRPDADLIRVRAEFYCAILQGTPAGENAVACRDIRLADTHSHYWLDLMRYLKAFDPSLKVNFFDGDTWENPDVPTIIKARRLDTLAPLSALLPLDSRRHILHPKDPVPFTDKKPVVLFRGDIHGKPMRIKMFEQWADAPFCDFGDTCRSNLSRWNTPPMPVTEHFDYQFILAPEGNDVASSLMWIMGSNCVPVMARPTVESWIMHSRLVPGVHYIEVASDYSDLGEKMAPYLADPSLALPIAEASKKWVENFLDPKREDIIAYLVLERYFKATGQI